MAKKPAKPKKKPVRRWARVAEPPGDPKLEAAQQLMYSALEASRPEQRMRLAMQALEISPDCADAYVLLAEHASNTKEVLDLLQKGVAAGERALGPDSFQEFAGHFWGYLETRPYMRARAALMSCLWTLGRREEAAEHGYDLLRLNPGDNQGIRYTLGAYLLDLGRDGDLRKLLTQYDEDGTNSLFNLALLEFRASGDSHAAQSFLNRACKANPYVSTYLLGLEPLPSEPPRYITLGDPSEAVAYTVDHMGAWKGTPGAIAWMRKTLKAPLPDVPARTAPSWPQLSKALARLPQSDAIWQVDVRPFASVVPGTSPQGSPWMVLVSNPAEDTILAFEMEPARPDAKQVWDHVVTAMLRPKEGPKQRPARIEVRLKTFCTAWSKKLREVGIQCVPFKVLEHIDRVIAETISPLTPAGLLEPDTATASTPFDPQSIVQYGGRAWQADIRRLPVWVGDDGEPRRPWSVLVTDRDSSLVLAQDISLDDPSPSWLADHVLKSMRQPLSGEPHRPGVVQVAATEYARVLTQRLADSGVEVEICDDLAEIDEIFSELSSRMSGPDTMTPLLSVPGVEPGAAAAFYAAAAEFYRKAPWRSVPGDAPIKVECAKFQSGPWYAVVMGQSALTFGLALYEGLDVLSSILTDGFSPDGAARGTSALSVMYGEAFEITIGDLEAIEKYGWPIAAPEAYPSVVRVNPGLAVRPPLAWELELVEGCLRAIPEFLRTQNRSQALTVPVSSGDLEMTLSHVEV